MTGLSPMRGPPGSRIIVRGENLGLTSRDIIKLTVNGADCLPYLEWFSPKKISTRCTRTLGSGDVVVTTNSGGTGTCDVQFNCYELKFVGPTEESEVWVDEIDYQAPEQDNGFNNSSTADEYSVELPSTRFNPQLYLIRNHPSASLEELEQLRSNLQIKLANKNDSESNGSDSNRAALLKSNLPVIMECLHILERLSRVITTSKDSSIDSIVKSIKESLEMTHELFDPLFKQNNMVQSIESAMQVFRRKDGTFFDLPVEIENSIEDKNYDLIVKEISNVIARLKIISIDPELKDKIEKDVSQKVEKLKVTIDNQLHESCRGTTSERNIDEVKKLITHLNKLGVKENFDVWLAIEEMSESLMRTVSEKFKLYLGLSLKEAQELCNSRTKIEYFNQRQEPPPVVKFVQSAMDMFHGTYYDILSLGQSYFDPKDEFACREEVRSDRFAIYNELISQPIHHLCSLLRLTIITNIDDEMTRERKALWPDYEEQKDMYINWLRHVLHKDWLRLILNSVITCHIHLAKSNLPNTASAPLEDFDKFVTELRRQSMEILFKNAALTNKNLHHKEDWVTEVDDQYGSITKLPMIFEQNVIDILKFSRETILKKSQPDETSILKNVAIQAEMKELAYGLINSFHASLDNALSSSEEHPAESALILSAAKGSTRIPTQLSNRLLITICNYQFTKYRVFPLLKDEFKKQLELNVEKVFEECGKKYRDYIEKTMSRFCAIKHKELTSECSDYFKSSSKEHGLNGNIDLQINLMIANSQIFLVAPQLVDELMPDIINKTIGDKTRVRL